MRRQLKQVQRSVRPPARLEPDPHSTTTWTSHLTDEVTALLARVDCLVGLRETG